MLRRIFSRIYFGRKKVFCTGPTNISCVPGRHHEPNELTKEEHLSHGLLESPFAEVSTVDRRDKKVFVFSCLG
jgi:hypothetical protein